MLGELLLRRVANAAQAGANAAACLGDFFIRGARDALLEINQARRGEDRMGVGVNEARKYDIVRAVDFVSFAGQFVLGDFVSRADGDDLSVGDQHCAVFDDAQLAHLRAATRAGVAGCAAQGQKLRGVDQESGGRGLGVGMQDFLSMVANSRSLDSD